MVTVRVCSKLNPKIGCFYKLSREEFSIFFVVFDKSIIPLALVGYEMILANSYPTRTHGIIVKYSTINFFTNTKG